MIFENDFNCNPKLYHFHLICLFYSADIRSENPFPFWTFSPRLTPNLAPGASPTSTVRRSRCDLWSPSLDRILSYRIVLFGDGGRGLRHWVNARCLNGEHVNLDYCRRRRRRITDIADGQRVGATRG